MSLNRQNGNREIPVFPRGDLDRDFGPKLTVVFQHMVYSWLIARPAVAYDDANKDRMALLIRGEIDETEEAQNQGETTHLITELADIDFYGRSFLFGMWLSDRSTTRELDIHRIHTQSQITRAGSGIYDRQREISGDLVSGGDKSILALEQLHIQTLALWRELAALGSPIMVMDWVANYKNPLNFPAEAANGLDPVTGQKLLPHERQAQHAHSRAALRILRKADGDREGGLRPDLYNQHRHQVLNFRGGPAVINDLKQEILVATNENGVE